MSRARAPFKAAFDAAVIASDHVPTDVTQDTVMATKALARWTKVYRTCYEANEWEDAWEGKALTVVGGHIAYSQISDARRFGLFSADPRPYQSRAYPVPFVTAADGIRVHAELAQVYLLALPKAPVFTFSGWAMTGYHVGDVVMHLDDCWLCITDHEATDWEADQNCWLLQPVLAVLQDAVTDMYVGQHLIDSKEYGLGKSRQNDAIAALENLHAVEFQRVSRWFQHTR